MLITCLLVFCTSVIISILPTYRIPPNCGTPSNCSTPIFGTLLTLLCHELNFIFVLFKDHNLMLVLTNETLNINLHDINSYFLHSIYPIVSKILNKIYHLHTFNFIPRLCHHTIDKVLVINQEFF